MMMGVLWNEEIRESLFWPGWSRGAGRGRVSSPRTQLLLGPVWPPSPHRPGPVSPAAPAPGECRECCGLSPTPCQSCPRGAAENTLTSHQHHRSRVHQTLSAQHLPPVKLPAAARTQWWTVCYEQVKAEHISQSPCAWVPGNQGSDHTRTKTKVAITFTSSAHKHQTSECWCPAPWPLPCPPWCPPGCPAPPPPPPSCPPSPPPSRSVARGNSTSQQQPGRIGCAASVQLWALLLSSRHPAPR